MTINAMMTGFYIRLQSQAKKYLIICNLYTIKYLFAKLIMHNANWVLRD